MTFSEDWAQLVSEASKQRPGATQLDKVDPGGADGGSGADLVVHQDDLGAVGHEAFRLHGMLHKQADIGGAGSDKSGSGSTAQAAKELTSRNLAMGPGLLDTLTFWESQVNTVLQMCAHISNHLDYSKKAHAKDDEELAASLLHRNGDALSVSEISKYVK
ncbi:hypothetical protein [Streptomyces palmae]|uniref:Uncharacterized protein n=1 Tax=Streptomyces palmae TaxID=1701085 RepID=A0A4Z0GZS7_9ACTN|nr:hypothetical protein [Streptomyces palmae]TGB03181.1 hypothetical protein E4099_19900 [Streptomyces palmae]